MREICKSGLKRGMATVRTAPSLLYCRHSISERPSVLHLMDFRTCLRSAQALLTSDAPVVERVNMERLAVGLDLPPRLPPGADAATRLATWDHWLEDRFRDKMERWHSLKQHDLLTLPADERDAYVNWQTNKSIVFSEKDIPALMALLGDTRPSRSIVRWYNPISLTVGDNALLALDLVFGCDPRWFVGFSFSKSWNDAARSYVATALQQWHKQHQGKPVLEVLLAELPKVPLHVAVDLIDRRARSATWNSSEQAALVAAVVAGLSQRRPESIDFRDFFNFMTIAGDHAGLAAVVSSWPKDQHLRPLVAVWHDQYGRPVLLDEIITEALEARNVVPPDAVHNPGTIISDSRKSAFPEYFPMTPGVALRLAIERPNQTRLKAIQSSLAENPQTGPCRFLLDELFVMEKVPRLLLFSNFRLRPYDHPWQDDNRRLDQRQQAMVVALGSILLTDVRQIPAGMLAKPETIIQVVFTDGTQTPLLVARPGRGTRHVGGPILPDWRICDFAAATILPWVVLPALKLSVLEFPLEEDLAKRDQVLVELRRRIATPAAELIKAAGLPESFLPTPQASSNEIKVDDHPRP